jgi:CheY-like chemotaxis protein
MSLRDAGAARRLRVGAGTQLLRRTGGSGATLAHLDRVIARSVIGGQRRANALAGSLPTRGYMPALIRPPPGTPASDAPRQARYRLLYVDAAAPSVGWMRGVIVRDCIELITASTGEAGIELARRRQPDLIIVDLGLLRANAAEVIRILRESVETYRIPILGLASNACANIPGLSMYCRRPIKRLEFRALLHALLGQTGPLGSHAGAGSFSPQSA